MTLADNDQLDLLAKLGDDAPVPPKTGHAADLPLVPSTAKRAKVGAVPAPPPRQVSMLASYADERIVTLVPDPPEYQGWREELGTSMPRFVNGACSEVRRPCPRTSCPLHLLLDVDEETGAITLNEGDPHRLGRPPELTEGADDDAAAAFEERALARLASMGAAGEDTCADDFARRVMRDGRTATEEEVGARLGKSHETVRLDTVRAFHKLKQLAAAGGYAIHDHNADARDAVAAMMLVTPRPPPPLVQIRRRTR